MGPKDTKIIDMEIEIMHAMNRTWRLASAISILGATLSTTAIAELPSYTFVGDLNNRELLQITNGQVNRVPTDISNDGMVMAMSLTNFTDLQPRLWLYDAAHDSSVAAGIEGLAPGLSLLQQNNMMSENHYLIGQSGTGGDEFSRCRIDTISTDPVTGAPTASDCQTTGRLQFASPPWGLAHMNDAGWLVHYEADNPLTVISEITITDPNGISHSLDISDIPTGETTRYSTPILSNGDTPQVIISYISNIDLPNESTTLRIYDYDGSNWLAQDYATPAHMFAHGANDGRILLTKRQLRGQDHSIYACQPALDSCASPAMIIDGTSTYQTLGGLTTGGLFYYGLQEIQNNNSVLTSHILYDLNTNLSLDLQGLLSSIQGYETAILQGVVISPDSSELILADSNGELLYFSTDPVSGDAGYDVTLTFYPPGQKRSHAEDLIAHAHVDNGVGPFEYRFIILERIQGATNPQVFNSGWQASPDLSISPIGLNLEQNKNYVTIVRVRDVENGNEQVISQKRLDLE